MLISPVPSVPQNKSLPIPEVMLCMSLPIPDVMLCMETPANLCAAVGPVRQGLSLWDQLSATKMLT